MFEKKKFGKPLKFFLALSLSLSFVFASVGKADMATSISYLQSQNQNAWITQALVAAEVTNPNISYIDTNTTDLMTAVKNILVLAALDSQDTETMNALLSVIQNNITENQLGSSDLLNDDFWGVMALASVGQDDYLPSLKNFILSHQNSDGGWSWSVDGESDSNDTAAAIMALLDAGLSSSATEIVNALDYLHNTQNSDGGFAYDVDSNSDGASTAWVLSALNKLEINPSSWSIEGNNPLGFLQSLEQQDGSYLWLPSDDQGSVMVTAYSVLALSGKSYPLNYVDLSEETQISGIDLRIEGPESTVCLASNLEADNVLDLLGVGAEVCGFDYQVDNSAYGAYVSSIDGIAASGMDGWQYFVNWHSGNEAAGDYQLVSGDEVLWAYGGWPLYPAKVEVNAVSLSNNESLLVSATYFDGSDWRPQAGADIHIGSEHYQANEAGQLTITMSQDGIYPVWAEMAEQYIRSNRVYVTVGNGVSETVDLSVNIENDSGGSGNDDTIAFSVSQSSINFGNMSPGQSAQTTISLLNTGSTGIYIEASIIGDSVFTNYTSLDQVAWEDYNINLSRDDSSSVNIGLDLPADIGASGQQSGQLIFWAIND